MLCLGEGGRARRPCAEQRVPGCSLATPKARAGSCPPQSHPAVPNCHLDVPSAPAVTGAEGWLREQILVLLEQFSRSHISPFGLVPFLCHSPREQPVNVSGILRHWCFHAQGGPNPSGLLPSPCSGCWRLFCFPFCFIFIWPRDPKKGIRHFNVILSSSRNGTFAS